MMISCSESEIISKGKLTEVNIGSINKKHKVCSIFQEKSINIPFTQFCGNIPKDIVMMVLLLMPIFVVKRGMDSYAVVGNLRVLKLARETFKRKEDKIKVNVIEDNERIVRHMALVEFILMPLIIRPYIKKENIKSVINEIRNENKKINIKRCINKIEKTILANQDANEKNIKLISCVRSKTQDSEILKIKLTKNCIRLLTEMYPIFVQSQSDNKYECVANQVVMTSIKENCRRSDFISVVEIKSLKRDYLKICEVLSFKIPRLIYGIPKGFMPQYGNLVKLMTKEDKAFIHRGGLTQDHMSKLVGYSRKYIFHIKPKIRSLKNIETKKEDMKNYYMDIVNGEVMQ